MSLPERNMEWTELRIRMNSGADWQIEERKTVFVALKDGQPYAVVCWSGTDAREAQQWLHSHRRK